MSKMITFVILVLLASCSHGKTDNAEYFLDEHSRLHYQVFMQNRELDDVNLHIKELLHQLTYIANPDWHTLVQEELSERLNRRQQLENEIKFKNDLMLYLEKDLGVACNQCK